MRDKLKEVYCPSCGNVIYSFRRFGRYVQRINAKGDAAVIGGRRCLCGQWRFSVREVEDDQGEAHSED